MWSLAIDKYSLGQEARHPGYAVPGTQLLLLSCPLSALVSNKSCMEVLRGFLTRIIKELPLWYSDNKKINLRPICFSSYSPFICLPVVLESEPWVLHPRQAVAKPRAQPFFPLLQSDSFYRRRKALSAPSAKESCSYTICLFVS